MFERLDLFGYGTTASAATLTHVGATSIYRIIAAAGHGGATAAEIIDLTNVTTLNLNPLRSDFISH